MKLKTLAIAIAAVAVSAPAMTMAAEKSNEVNTPTTTFNVNGDVGIRYQDINGVDAFQSAGSNITFSASETRGGITYFGQADFDFTNGGNFVADDLRVGVKGAFGEIVGGDTDNGCDATDIGGSNEVWLTHTQGGCAGSDVNNLTYKRSIGPAAFAISHNVNTETNALGVSGKVGKFGVSLGYEDLGDTTSNSGSFCQTDAQVVLDRDGNEFCIDGSNLSPGTSRRATRGGNTVLGITGGIGPFAIGFRANKQNDVKAKHGINFLYSRNGHNFYGGGQTSSQGEKDKSLGYKRVMGNSDFIIEAEDTGSDTNYVIGMRHRF